MQQGPSKRILCCQALVSQAASSIRLRLRHGQVASGDCQKWKEKGMFSANGNAQ